MENLILPNCRKKDFVFVTTVLTLKKKEAPCGASFFMCLYTKSIGYNIGCECAYTVCLYKVDS